MSRKASPTRELSSLVVTRKPSRPTPRRKIESLPVEPKIDRRVRRTRDVLGDALVDLIQEKPFDAITVKNVLERSGVGRSTFYSHYRDKDDLFLSDADDFFAGMSTLLARSREQSNRVAPVREMFAHLADVRDFHTALVASNKIHDIWELGQGHFARSIDDRLAIQPSTRALSPKRRSALAQALAGAMLSLLTWWIRQGMPASPARMDDLFHQLVWSGVTPPQSRVSSPDTAKRHSRQG
jgi:AcrR family transcriptional regulator